MNKKILCISVMVIVLVLSLFAFTACDTSSSEIGEELVVNGDFSNFNDTAKKLEGWSTSTNDVKYGQTQTSNEGEKYLYIDNTSAKYSYLYQTIKVDTNQIYKISVDVEINTKINSKVGAYVAFLENVELKFATTTDKTDGFETKTFYVKPKNTDYLTLALCVGSEDTPSMGRANFDNVSVQRVNKSDVPSGVEVVNFRKVKTVNTNVDASGTAFVVLLTLFSVAVILWAYFIIRRQYAKQNAFVDFGADASVGSSKSLGAKTKWYNNAWFIGAMIMLGAFLLRLIFILTMYGTGNQLSTLLNLGRNTLTKTNGVFNYYANNPSSTYSPGVIYILAILGFMTKGASLQVSSIVFRLINALADVAVVGMIYSYGRKHVGNRLSAVYACLYALLPFSLFMGGLNGGFESLLVALIVGAMILMVEKKYLATYFVMTLASVLDIRAMALAPIVVTYFVYMYIKDNDDKKKFTANRAQIVFGLVGSFVLAYLITLPIGINQISAGDAFFNFKVIVNELTKTTYYTSNGLGMYGMVAMNGRTVVRGVEILNLMFLLVLEAYVISLYFKNRNRQELILLASFTLAVIGVFTIKVTYTYMFLSLALGLIYTMVSGDRRMYGVMGGIASLGFLNVAQLMNQSGLVARYAAKAITSYETKNVFFILFSVMAVLLVGYYAYVCYSITNNTKIVDIPAMTETFGKTVKTSFANLKAKLKRQKASD